MTTTLAVLVEAAFGTAGGIVYTSDNCVTSIDKLTATNESAASAPATAALYSPDGTQVEAIGKTVMPGQTWTFPEAVGHILDAGGKLVLSCPTANAVKFRASGRKFT